jgi:hypothetical protein
VTSPGAGAQLLPVASTDVAYRSSRRFCGANSLDTDRYSSEPFRRLGGGGLCIELESACARRRLSPQQFERNSLTAEVGPTQENDRKIVVKE